MQRINKIIDTLDTISRGISKKYNISEDFILISLNKNNSLSVWLTELTTGKKSKCAFTVQLKGKKDNKYISFVIKKSNINNINVPDNAILMPMKSSSQHICLNFYAEENDFEPIIKELLNCAISTFEPSDKFGCCDKYIECSNAKKCLHNNLFYAKACYYRKNLESGKIFYGDNKNI